MIWRPPRTFRNLDDPVTGFQVLGERSSGTNYVTQLLLRNLAGEVPRRLDYGWKHGFIDRRVAAEEGLLTLIVHRHPIRWIQSLHARPHDLSLAMKGLPFGAFIRHEWQGAFQKPQGEEPSTADLSPKGKQPYPNPLRLRSAKISYLEELAGMPGRIAYLRFEDANRDPRATLEALGAAFGLSLRRFQPVTTYKGITRAKYAPKPMPPIAEEDMRFIRGELDLELEAGIGYRLEDVPRFDGLPGWDPRSLRTLARGARLSPRSGGRFRRGRG